jgi:hypothetical protein
MNLHLSRRRISENARRRLRGFLWREGDEEILSKRIFFLKKGDLDEKIQKGN